MKCQLCHEREATVLYTHIVDNHKKSLHLCSYCAAREPGGAQGPTIADGSLAGDKGSAIPVAQQETIEGPAAASGQRPAAATGRCEQCGMTYEEFKKVGRLGCGGCYTAFGEPLERLLKRIHGAIQHVGKGRVPPRPAVFPQEELARLREQLQAAVAAEAYEKAAELRDRIRQLEGELRTDPAATSIE